MSLKFKARIDDSLDVFAVHLVGGVVGALSIGFLGDAAINGHNGLFYGGGFLQLGRQAMGVGAVLAYDFVLTLIIAKVIDLIMGLRVSRDVELEGLDINLHAESAYDFGAPATHASVPAVVTTSRAKVDA